MASLRALHDRAQRNGVQGLRLLGPGEMREAEPAVAGCMALHSPETGVIDFPAVARAMGCHGRAVESPAALTDAITAAFDADRPTLLHIRENSRATQQG
jgi:acetolactate synthase-1/2/3 large subunit